MSTTSVKAGEQAVAAGRVVAVAVGGEAARLPAKPALPEAITQSTAAAASAPSDLRDHVRRARRASGSVAGDQAERDGRVEVAAGDVSDGVGHRQTR